MKFWEAMNLVKSRCSLPLVCNGGFSDLRRVSVAAFILRATWLLYSNRCWTRGMGLLTPRTSIPATPQILDNFQSKFANLRLILAHFRSFWLTPKIVDPLHQKTTLRSDLLSADCLQSRISNHAQLWKSVSNYQREPGRATLKICMFHYGHCGFFKLWSFRSRTQGKQ